MCSLGAKNYGLKCENGTQIIKVKGFTLSKHASDIITFQLMVDMVEKNDPDYKVDVTSSHSIIRNLQTRAVFTRSVTKRYGITFDKRVLHDDFTTRPYGFKHNG
jgi:hypothetical protein